MPASLMHLKVLLPFQVFADQQNVSRIVAETREGAFGLLPHRLDCVAALAPGILIFETESGGVTYVAVDAGTLIKYGLEVLVSVRRAQSGSDLAELRSAVEKQYIELDEEEQSLRTALTKMESGFLHRFAEFQHE